jgi:hypothetical protein
MKIRDLESEQCGPWGGGHRKASLSPVEWQARSSVGVGGVNQNAAISQLSKKLEEVHNELEGKKNTIKELSMQVKTLNPKLSMQVKPLNPKP